MRLLTTSLFVLSFIATPLLAQPQMSEQQMQMLMRGAAEMQACFAKLDQSQLEAMGKKAEAMEKELKAMCAADQRAEAQSRAVAYAREFSESPEMQQLKECGQIAQAMMPVLMAQIESLEHSDDPATHVCDNL